jgi:hypothetical protein
MKRQSLLLAIPLIATFNAFPILSIGSGSLRILDLVFVFYLTLLGAYLTQYPQKKPFKIIILIAFGLLYSTSVFIVSGGDQYQDVLRFWLLLFWAPIGLAFLGKEGDFRRSLSYLILSCTLISLYHIFIYLTEPEIHRIGGYHGFSGGEGLNKQASYNEIGAYLSIGLVVILVTFFHSGRKSLIVLAMLNLVGLLLSGSRSGILALIVAILLTGPNLGWITFRIRIANIGRIFFIILPLFLLTSFMVISADLHIVSRVLNAIDENSNAGESVVSRLELWRSVAIYLTTNPFEVLFGLGKNSGYGDLNTHTLENFWLDVIFSYGFFGFIIVSYIILFPIIWLARAQQKTKSEKNWMIIKAIFLVTIVASLTGNVLADPMLLSSYLILTYGAVSETIKEGNRS